jgi:tetratricopeptide (TPR) repeat protein
MYPHASQIKTRANKEITDNYIMFTSGKENHSKDTVFIYYKDIINQPIIYYVKVTEGGFYMPYVKIGEHLLTSGGKELADLIFHMQHRYALKYYQEDLENFKTISANYQKLSEKPEISEAQRKLFVQGNAVAQSNVADAIAYYEKAIAINPISSPAGYYNYAIIASIAENYELAILNMEKYILLLPDAEDLRTAQDKIYEWETFIKK